MSKDTSHPPSVDFIPSVQVQALHSIAIAILTYLVYPETSPTPSPTFTTHPFGELLVKMEQEQSLECIILTQAMMSFSATS
jgi:hypothetical protein